MFSNCNPVLIIIQVMFDKRDYTVRIFFATVPMQCVEQYSSVKAIDLYSDYWPLHPCNIV